MEGLLVGSTLQGGKYRIIKTLGQGGFGITYLATQVGLDRKVAIKEFFMKDFCWRNETTSQITLGTAGSREKVNLCRERFLKEARHIAKLKHPNIVRIIDVFDENSTSYYVMEYIEGGSLANKVEEDGMSVSDATRYILQVAEALNYIHQNKICHLDVKPGNIMLNENDDVILIDFGVSKQYDLATGSQTNTTPIACSVGYAPLEQYKPSGIREFSPQTDIYSLGATYFKLLTGITPPNAFDITEDFLVDKLKAKGIKQEVIYVICKSMKRNKKARTNEVNTFVDELKKTILVNIEIRQRNNDETIVLNKPSLRPINTKGEINRTEAQKNSNRHFCVHGVSFDMIFVKGGSFTFSRSVNKTILFIFEYRKEKYVNIHFCDYYIGETPVTQELWKTIMGTTPSFYKGENRPVENISWIDCIEFISKLNEMTGEQFCLPTDLQWEFAARGGIYSKNYKCFGCNKIGDLGFSAYKMETHDVGTEKVNELGLYDMFTNVSEACMYVRDVAIPPIYGSRPCFCGKSRFDISEEFDFSDKYFPDKNNKTPMFGLRLALFRNKNKLISEFVSKSKEFYDMGLKDKAFLYLAYCASVGDAESQYKLGGMYYRGEDIAQNYEKSILWLERAAKQNHTYAQELLANLYWEGKGAEKDEVKALQLFYKAFKNGDKDLKLWVKCKLIRDVLPSLPSNIHYDLDEILWYN